MKYITCWYATDQDGRTEFNHISEGYSPSASKPTPLDEYQKKAWLGKRWYGQCAVLRESRVYEIPAPGLLPFKPQQVGPVRWT